MEVVASSYSLKRIGKWWSRLHISTYLWLYLFGPLKQILSFAVDCNKKEEKDERCSNYISRGLGGRCIYVVYEQYTYGMDNVILQIYIIFWK